MVYNARARMARIIFALDVARPLPYNGGMSAESVTDPDHTPLFSVVIPAYKAEKFIALTLQSVYRQTEQDFEVVVVNDGSPDGTGDVLARETDPRLRVINRENGGECVARNTGTQATRGTYIAYLDSDDAWLPNHLELARRFFELHPDYNWYASTVRRVENISEASLETAKPLPAGKAARGVDWFLEAEILPSATVVRRSALPCTDLFPAGIKMHGDCVGWCRLARVNPRIGLLAHATVLYRVWPGSATSAYLAIGRGANSGAELDVLLMMQGMAAEPECGLHEKLFLRSFYLINWWMRIRSCTLKPWLPEIAKRRPLTGAFLSAWLKLCVYANHFVILSMGKLVRMRYNALQRKRARLGAKLRRTLPME